VRKLDLTIDPPPDLAIEVDLTSKTKLEAYQAIAVPEVWIYLDRRLKIYVLRDDKYLESQFSPIFGNLPIADIIPQFVEQSLQEGRSTAIRAFRAWVEQNVETP
jgi:Uma2 family endonuclease